MADAAVELRSFGETLEIPGFTPDEDMAGYRVATPLLEPRFRLGDVLLCHQEPTPLTECHGRDCVVEFNGQRLLRLVEPGANPLRTVTLRGYRANTPSIVDVSPTGLWPVISTIHAAAH